MSQLSTFEAYEDLMRAARHAGKFKEAHAMYLELRTGRATLMQDAIRIIKKELDL